MGYYDQFLDRVFNRPQPQPPPLNQGNGGGIGHGFFAGGGNFWDRVRRGHQYRMGNRGYDLNPFANNAPLMQPQGPFAGMVGQSTGGPRPMPNTQGYQQGGMRDYAANKQQTYGGRPALLPVTGPIKQQVRYTR